jgi:DNA repair exonuclease SbcCD ATPase subunit
MPEISLKPTMLVARATQMAADSIGVIDEQIRAAGAIHVDAAALPSLSNDLGALNRTLQQWPQQLRALAVETLRGALNLDTAVLQNWPRINQQDQGALLNFARVMQQYVNNASGAIGRLQTALAPFRTAIDQSVSTLQGDLRTVSNQLAAEQQMANMLEQQVQQQQDRINYYNSHPWQLILDGLTIIGLIRDLQNINNAENEAREALSRLRQIEPQLQQLSQARGPLLGLSLAVAGLGGGVGNMQTAIAQVANQLNGILQQPPLPAIMAAMLGAAVEDLSAADGIINEMLAGG